MIQCYLCGCLVEPQHVWRREIESAKLSNGKSICTMENLCPRCGRNHDAWEGAFFWAIIAGLVVAGTGFGGMCFFEVAWFANRKEFSQTTVTVAIVAAASSMLTWVLFYFKHKA